MEQQERDRLVEIMGRIAGGDLAAVVTLYSEFGTRIVAAVRRQLRHLHVDDVAHDDLQGLVMDACFALADCAGGWDPDGGALPWVWAERRIGNVVQAFVGQHADDLGDVDRRFPDGPAARGDEPEPLALLGREDRPVCRLLADAFDAADVSERDRRLLLDYQVQHAMGDTSPALTVAPHYGMNPASVRQAVKRTKDRLRHLAGRDERYRPLADLALLA